MAARLAIVTVMVVEVEVGVVPWLDRADEEE